MPVTGSINAILPRATWRELYISCRMHHVVLDEADLLLSGGFERDVSRILDSMKQSDRERKAQCLSQELGIPLEAFQALPRHVKAAAYEGAALRIWGLISDAVLCTQLESKHCNDQHGQSLLPSGRICIY